MGNSYERDSDSGFGLGAWLFGLFIGALGGVTVGLLVAPKSGKDLRGDLKENARNIPERASELMDDTLDLYASGCKLRPVGCGRANNARKTGSCSRQTCRR